MSEVLGLPNRILGVDDEASWRRILSGVFDKTGYEWSINENAGLAVAEIQSREHGLVVTDGLNGEWRRVAAAAQEVGAGAILLSGDEAAVESARAQGFIAAFNKGGREWSTALPEVIVSFFGRTQE